MITLDSSSSDSENDNDINICVDQYQYPTSRRIDGCSLFTARITSDQCELDSSDSETGIISIIHMNLWFHKELRYMYIKWNIHMNVNTLLQTDKLPDLPDMISEESALEENLAGISFICSKY